MKEDIEKIIITIEDKITIMGFGPSKDIQRGW